MKRPAERRAAKLKNEFMTKRILSVISWLVALTLVFMGLYQLQYYEEYFLGFIYLAIAVVFIGLPFASAYILKGRVKKGANENKK